jgi:hypothetical protein
MANQFGGKGKHGLYTPMSELEQEAVHRLVENQDLVVNVVGWGVVNQPRIIVGDLRVGIHFRLDFNAPVTPIPIYHFDLELRTRSGLLLFKDKKSCCYGGRPLMCGAGIHVDMAWDIAIMHMDPKVVKAILPGAIGLTSRFIDRDTGEATMFGNNNFSSSDKNMLLKLREMERSSRQLDQDNLTTTEKIKAKDLEAAKK